MATYQATSWFNNVSLVVWAGSELGPQHIKLHEEGDDARCGSKEYKGHIELAY